MDSQKGAIYFDGLCIACSTEINHYRKQKGSEYFDFIDITNPEFDPLAHGLDPFKVHKVMHVRDQDGTLYEGVDAFRTIWAHLPRYKKLAKLADLSVVRLLLEFGYKAFVIARPYLPRRKADCSASPYCEISK